MPGPDRTTRQPVPAMPEDVSFTVSLPAELAAGLRRAAAERGWTPESLIADCVAQHLEIAVRHRALVERLEQVDAALLEMARAAERHGAVTASLQRLRPGADAAAYYLTQSQDEAHPDRRRAAYYQAEGVGVW